MSIAIALHLLSAVVWVGGMFFAYMALRPAASSVLEPPLRQQLWRATFDRFFPWVWAAVILLLVTGYWLLLTRWTMATAPIYLHIMQGLGILMILLYLHVFFAPFRRMKKALDAGDHQEAGRRLGQIRTLIGVNLILGLIVVVAASAGRYLV